MKKEIKSIRGMHDYFLQDINIWNYIERILKKILNSYCYLEIKLPIIEKTEIFNRTIGQVTDIIEKEMYSFYDRKGCSITLRPEGTVGCVRAVIQNRLLEKKYHKFWYLGPMFRYERPQSGRYRQFYQLGGEVFGLNTEDIDLEIILLTHRMWQHLGIDSHLILEVNFIGSQQERLKYKKDLTSFLEKRKNLLDEDSKRRIYTNPLRVLDSKNQDIQKLLKHAPILKEYINLDSYKHFKNLCSMMDYHKISYTHNAKLIRGLDYYNNTVFEWKSNRLGAQNTICAGGRYDSLFQEMGAPKTAAIGFAIGIERLMLLIKELNIFPLEKISIDIYIIFISEKNKNEAIILSEELRTLFPYLKIFIDFFQKKTKKKIKNAVKHLSNIAILIGIDKNKKDFFVLKDLKKIKEYYLSKHQLIEKLKIFFNKK